MTLPIQPVTGVPGDKPSSDIGIFAKRGGIILSTAKSINLLDKDINGGIYFKILHVGSGGNLVYRTPDNQIDCYLGLKDGQMIAVVGSAVLSSATIQGALIETSCDDITWKGGE